jgi:hypothetical protein
MKKWGVRGERGGEEERRRRGREEEERKRGGGARLGERDALEEDYCFD